MARKSREDWLQMGLQVLVEEGLDALRIDTLCKQLEVTKGSFYHHFQNRENYLEAMLGYWEEEYTSEFIEYSQKGEGPQEQLIRLQQRVLGSYGGQESVIRAWAQHSALAREFQERVDAKRVAYLKQLYEKLVGDPAEAEILAHLIYTGLIGGMSMMPPLPPEQLAEMFGWVASHAGLHFAAQETTAQHKQKPQHKRKGKP